MAMNWYTWLILAMVLAVIAAVTGFKAKGTRHVAGTKLMGAARAILVIVVLFLLYMAYTTHAGK